MVLFMTSLMTNVTPLLTVMYDGIALLNAITKKLLTTITMSEFKYGDMVEVRDFANKDWVGPVFYLGSIPLPNGGTKHFTMICKFWN